MQQLCAYLCTMLALHATWAVSTPRCSAGVGFTAPLSCRDSCFLGTFEPFLSYLSLHILDTRNMHVQCLGHWLGFSQQVVYPKPATDSLVFIPHSLALVNPKLVFFIVCFAVDMTFFSAGQQQTSTAVREIFAA